MAIHEFTCERCGKRCRASKANHLPPSRFCSKECMRNVPEDVWKFIDKSGGPNACWEWRGVITSDGYGRFCIDQQRLRSHRIVYELTHRQIPDGMVVCHSCDRPSCCNPAHLFLGTHIDNMADRKKKGRAAAGLRNGAYTKPERVRRGASNGRAKLTAGDVRTIRRAAAAGESAKSLAARFGVSPAAVHFVISRRNWHHVE